MTTDEAPQSLGDTAINCYVLCVRLSGYVDKTFILTKDFSRTQCTSHNKVISRRVLLLYTHRIHIRLIQPDGLGAYQLSLYDTFMNPPHLTDATGPFKTSSDFNAPTRRQTRPGGRFFASLTG